MQFWHMLHNSLIRAVAVVLFVVVVGLPVAGYADPPVIMPVRSIDLSGVQKCYDDPQSSDFCDRCNGPNYNNTSLTNYVLLRETLKAGGMGVNVVGIDSPNSARSRLMVADGVATVKADWDFNIAGNDSVLKSDAFIEAGELFKGIYGLPDNSNLQKARDLDDIRRLTAVSNPHWRLDWMVLTEMNLASLYPVSTTGQMYHLIAQGRADFTLLEFSPRSDMMREFEGGRLLPVPGLKVAMPNAQHFMVSRQSPRAEEIIQTLNSGLMKIRENGLLSRCLHQGGLVNASTRDWKILNADKGIVAKNRFY